jgi:hypothetical protein
MGLFLLFFVLSLASLAHAQTDVVVPVTNTPYVAVGSNLAWTASGAGGLTNNFIFVPPSSDSSQCLYVQNADATNPHTVGLQVYSTGNPSVKTFTGNSGAWSLVASSQITIASSTAQSFYLPTRSAARIAVSITGTGTGSTANVFAVWSSQSACGVPFTKIFVCGMVVTAKSATAVGTMSMGPAPVSLCNIVPVNDIAVSLTTGPLNFSFGGTIGFFMNTVNKPICITTDQDTTGMNVFLTYTYQ